MTRYRVLRTAMGCDPLTAGVIAGMNWLMGVPKDRIQFMHITIEIKQ